VERPEHSPLGPRLSLAELLGELQARLQAGLRTRDRADALLDAVVTAGSEPDLEAVLGRIVEAAVRLADGRCGAPGTIGESGAGKNGAGENGGPAGMDGGDLVAALAAAGAAADSAEHHRESERMAVAADRDRIARDLHDLVIQRLFAIGMSLQTATGTMPAGPAADRVRQSVDELDDTIHAIRSAIFTLQSSLKPDRPRLRAQIMAVTDEMTGALGFAPSLRLAGPLDTAVPRPVADGLLAALRERLANVARHAGASAAEVSAEAAGGRLRLIIADNSVSLTHVRRGGVADVADRARSLGGTARLAPAAGGGTLLEWDVPLCGAPAGQPA
jgi:signal transduction histidine kinase